LLGAGATVSVSGVGVPVGTILMALGAVLAIGSGIVDIIRDLLLAKTRQAMKPLLEDFSKPGSAYDRIVSLKDGGSLRYPKLKQSLEKVWERHAIDFWDIHPKKCPELWDVGFTVKHIEGFVDEDFSRVTNILKSAGREWWKRELKKAPS
jgi:hypothetical protein